VAERLLTWGNGGKDTVASRVKKRSVVGISTMLLSMACLVQHASAQETTRAKVRQEVIKVEYNGLQCVTETS
jgi:hypothetical protein